MSGAKVAESWFNVPDSAYNPFVPDKADCNLTLRVGDSDYDGANDASLVFHEYAHGLSNRLLTDAAGFGALNTAQAGAIGEGLSEPAPAIGGAGPDYQPPILQPGGGHPDDLDAVRHESDPALSARQARQRRGGQVALP